MLKNIKNYFNKKNLKDKKFEFLFDENIPKNEFIVFDCETTGLNPKEAEILSIGAVKIVDNKIMTSEKFHIFLKPTKEIDENSIKIHHIRHCDLLGATEPNVAIEKFLNFIKNRTLIGYYLEFDVKMINKYLKPMLGITLPNREIEISGLYFDKKIGLIPQANIDLRFDSILKDLNLPSMGKHSALNDSIMTALIFLKLKKENYGN